MGKWALTQGVKAAFGLVAGASGKADSKRNSGDEREEE